MAREKFDMDEASLVEQIADRGRTLKASIPQKEKPAPEQDEKPPAEEMIPDEPPQEETAEEPAQAGKAPQPRREASKRKRGQAESIDEVFLKRKELKTRQSVYISQDVHASIARLVHVLALTGNEISVGGYIDNVLTEHLESHKEAIAEMCRQQLGQFL